MKTLILAFFIGITGMLSIYYPVQAEENNGYNEGSFKEVEVDTNPPNVEGQEVFHEVVKGDTLYLISVYYHVDFKELLELNTQFKDPDLIYPKDKVKIPPNQIEDVYFQHS